MDLADMETECIEALLSVPEDDEEYDFYQSRIFPTDTNASPHAGYDYESDPRAGIDIERAFLGLRVQITRSEKQQRMSRFWAMPRARRKWRFGNKPAQRWDAIRALERILADDST